MAENIKKFGCCDAFSLTVKRADTGHAQLLNRNSCIKVILCLACM